MSSRGDLQQATAADAKKGQVIVACIATIAVVGALLVWQLSTEEDVVASESFVMCPIEGCVSDLVSSATGRLWMTHTDIGADPASGAIGLDRTYFRGDATSSSFGPGWRSILDTRLEERDEVHVLVGFASLPGTPLSKEDRTVTFSDGTRWTFAEDGSLAAIWSRSGQEFTISRSGDSATFLGADEPLFQFEYENGRVREVADLREGGAGTVSYSYVDGRLAEVTSILGEDTTESYRYGYNPGGGLTRVVDSRGTTEFVWSDARAIEQISTSGQVTSIELPTESGGPTLVWLPGATRPTEYAHDSSGRLIEIRQGDSVPLRREYDPQGRLVFESDASDQRQYDWDEDHLARVESDANGTTEMKWDDFGRLLATTNDGLETTYEYADAQWAPTAVSRDGATTSYEYRDGSLVEVTDPDGVVTVVDELPKSVLASAAAPLTDLEPACGSSTDGLDLDDSCRPVRFAQTDSDDSPEAEVAYDEYGRVAASTGPNGSEEFTYDERGRVASVTHGDTTYTNVYSGSRLVRVDTGGRAFTEYQYDDAGRLRALTGTQASATRSYDDTGRLARIESGGLVWEVTEFTEAGRPTRIDTPYGTVEVTYDREGRVSTSEVRNQSDGNSSKDPITTSYDWGSTAEGETARIERGGFVSTLTFEQGRLTSARTPLGAWAYAYDGDNPELLTEVTGPDGTTDYTWGSDDFGTVRLDQILQGDRIRTLEWDEFGRLTRDEGDSWDRSFEYRADGVTQSGSEERRVVWNEAGLPVTVQGGGTTEQWTWNPDRTVHSVTVEGRGLPFPADEQTWTAAYDDAHRLVGFDKSDSDDDLVVEWSKGDTAVALPTEITRGDGEVLRLAWTDMGELRSAALGEESWEVSRDDLRMVTGIEKAGGSEGELTIDWNDGIPVDVSTDADSIHLRDCSEATCRVEITVDDQTVDLDYHEDRIVARSGDRETAFDRDDQGLITAGCQEIDGEQRCTDWLSDGTVGERSDLARFEELLGGTNGQLKGISSRPLLADPPAIASLPEELRPAGLQIVLPDEGLEAAIASAAPAIDQPFQLGSDGAVARLASRLANTSVVVAHGPGSHYLVDVLANGGLADFDTEIGDAFRFTPVARALTGIEPDSILRGASDFVADRAPQVLKFAALLSTGVFTAGLGIAATACTSDPLLCIQAAAAAAVALVPLALGAAASAGWIPAGVAVAAGLAMVSIAAIVDGAAAVAEGTPWRQAAFVAMSSMVVGLVARGTKVGVALCKSRPAICTRVVSTLTDPRKVVRQVNRVGLQVVGMFSGVTGSQPLLDGSSTNDYGGYQAQRKDLLDARLGHLNASGNDSTSLADRAAALDMPVGARRAILIVDSRDRALSELESMGVGVALLASGQR